MTSTSASSVQVRPAQEADAASIARIYNSYVAAGNVTMDRGHWSVSKTKAKIQGMSARECWLVLETPAQVVGWSVLKQYSDRWGYRVCCESSIYLSPTQTGKGYGSTLQTALIDQARAFGYHHIIAKILGDNEGSITFHERFGFEVVGRQKEVGHLKGRWQDVVILQLIFPDITPDMIPD